MRTPMKAKKKVPGDKQKGVKNILAVLDKRLHGMVSVEPKLDLGGGVSVPALTKHKTELEQLLSIEVKAETELAAIRVRIANETQVVRGLNERSLSAVAGRYGIDSEQYKQVGGTRRSERRKPVRKPRLPKTASAPAATTTTSAAAPLVAPVQAFTAPAVVEVPRVQNGHSA